MKTKEGSREFFPTELNFRIPNTRSLSPPPYIYIHCVQLNFQFLFHFVHHTKTNVCCSWPMQRINSTEKLSISLVRRVPISNIADPHTHTFIYSYTHILYTYILHISMCVCKVEWRDEREEIAIYWPILYYAHIAASNS